jgi:asparagine synthase (glutamine-hydrolysing)
MAKLAPGNLARQIGTLAARDPVDRQLAMSGRLDPGLRASLVRGPLSELDGQAGRNAIAAHTTGLTDDPLSSTLYLDAKLALPDDMLHYFDRASMAHSLEVRVPFLDHELVEFCATIPADLKVHRLTTKHVLREAARGLVPDHVIDKKKIGFFSHAIDGWFRAQTRGVVSDHLLGPNPRYAELLDRGGVERLVADHASGKDERHGRLLLSVLMLEIWLSSFLPRAMRPAPVDAGDLAVAG